MLALFAILFFVLLALILLHNTVVWDLFRFNDETYDDVIFIDMEILVQKMQLDIYTNHPSLIYSVEKYWTKIFGTENQRKRRQYFVELYGEYLGCRGLSNKECQYFKEQLRRRTCLH